MRFVEKIGPICNVYIEMRERGKLITRRVGHNVFTTTGRDWLAHLGAWAAIGSPDVPFTNRRVRWMSVGTGAQAEVEGLTAMDTPVEVTSGRFLAPIDDVTFPATKSVEFFKRFSEGEISFAASPIPITEVGLLVDVFPVSTGGGTEDSAVGSEDTTLNPLSDFNPPVAYKTFAEINKTPDFALEVRWEFRF